MTTTTTKPIFKDELFINTTVMLSFADRLRILLLGRLVVSTRTKTENVVGACRTESDCTVPHFFPKKLQSMTAP